jgi:hypothetical protein
MTYRFGLQKHKPTVIHAMQTLSQESTEYTIKKSAPKKVNSFTTESSLPRIGKTPPAKQAKRYKKSSGSWKGKAVQRSSKIVAQEKSIAEIRKSREFHRQQNKDILAQFEQLTLVLNQTKQMHMDEKARGDEEFLKRLSAEAEAINTNFKLEKATDELREANMRMELFSTSQNGFQNKIASINTQIDGYKFEKLCNPESILIPEMSVKIQKGILKLEDEVRHSEAALEIEIKELKKQVKQGLSLFKNCICKNLSNLYQQGISYAIGRIKRLKTDQDGIKDRLKSTNGRFENKKNRQGEFRSHKRAKGYSFSAIIIRLTLLLLINGALSIRAVAKAMEINSIFLDFPTPSYTIVSEWAKKIGFYIYNLPKDRSIDRLWIIDFSIQVGQNKLMLVLGIDIEKIKTWKKYTRINKKRKSKLKIRFKDVEVLHMAVVKSTIYQITLKELEEVAAKCGLPLFILSDEGSDLAKGIRVFIEKNSGIQHLHDISHKLSNILKNTLEKNEKWKEFSEIVTMIRQKIKLSDIAEMCPPKFRQKVRYLNVRDPLEWAVIMLNMDFANFTTQQKFNFNTNIKIPLDALKDDIMQWHGYISFITLVESEIKHNGLTRGDDIKIQSTSDILTEHLKGVTLKMRGTYDQIIEFVRGQESKLSPGQTIIGSSDIVESVFGKWKSMAHEDSMAGITNLILLLPLLTVNITDDLVIKALEDTPIQKINDWSKKNLGTTMYTKRRAILDKKNKAKVDKKMGGNTRGSLEKAA